MAINWALHHRTEGLEIDRLWDAGEGDVLLTCQLENGLWSCKSVEVAVQVGFRELPDDLQGEFLGSHSNGGLDRKLSISLEPSVSSDSPAQTSRSW